MSDPMNCPPTALRLDLAVLCAARLLASLIIAFWGFFIIAHLLGDSGAPASGLTQADYLGITLMVTALLGLGIAFKWEMLGATVTLASVALGALQNWRILLFPATLIPIVALLFLTHALLIRRTTGSPTPR